MDAQAVISSTTLLEQLSLAINRHDLDALADCFHTDYDSTFPAHPSRAFQGRDQMRRNWSRIFARVPNIQSVLVRSAHHGETVWAEWEWTGTRSDGEPFDMRGVTIQEFRNGKATWVRMYMEPVERGSGDVDGTIERSLGQQSAG